MVDTKEIVDIFLKSEITTISNFDSYKVSRLGGITNVNFKVEIGSQKFVLRLPGKNPDTSLNREAEKNNQLVAVEAGLTLPFLYFDVDSGVKISEFKENLKALEPEELKSKEYLDKALDTLDKLHKSGIKFYKCFDHNVFFQQTNYEEKYKEIGETGEFLIEKINKIEEKLVPCHKDIFGPNFILLEEEMYLIDWEYSGMASRFFDYGDLCCQQNIEEEQRKEIFYKLKLEKNTEQQVLWNLYRYLTCLTWGLWATKKGELDEEADKEYLNQGKKKIKLVLETVNSKNFDKHLSLKF